MNGPVTGSKLKRSARKNAIQAQCLLIASLAHEETCNAHELCGKQGLDPRKSRNPTCGMRKWWCEAFAAKPRKAELDFVLRLMCLSSPKLSTRALAKPHSCD